jgi:hypothetical protein
MRMGKPLKFAAFAGILLAMSGCGDRLGFFERSNEAGVDDRVLEQRQNTPLEIQRRERRERGSVWDLFSNRDDPNVTVEVNKYLWNASLEVLNFLPIESADPFTGVIVTGYGTPPGGGRAYRATVLIQDPALDARSLSLSLMTRNGAASRQTVRAVEDAILTRARQLRIRDSRL